MKNTSYQPQVRNELMSRIDAIDLAPIKFKLMDKHEGKGWSRDYVNKLETEYKRFLYLTTSQSEVPVVPNKDLDEFWHAHILDTRKYAEDCETTFGKFIHHFPYLGMRGEEDAKLLQTSFTRTKGLYERVFGESYDKDKATCYGDANCVSCTSSKSSDCENCGSCGASCGVCSSSGSGGRLSSELGFNKRPTLESVASNIRKIASN